MFSTEAREVGYHTRTVTRCMYSYSKAVKRIRPSHHCIYFYLQKLDIANSRERFFSGTYCLPWKADRISSQMYLNAAQSPVQIPIPSTIEISTAKNQNAAHITGIIFVTTAIEFSSMPASSFHKFSITNILQMADRTSSLFIYLLNDFFQIAFGNVVDLFFNYYSVSTC